MSNSPESLSIRPVHPRTLKDHAQRRQSQREQTQKEITELAARFHAQLPRDRAKAIGSIYARFSTRYQASVFDQVRTCFEDAVRRGIFVPLENIFFDLAQRGCKRDREGLLALQKCIEAKVCTVLLVLTSNRLHRKMHRALQFIDEEIVERGLRAIFVKTGVDTADVERWRLLLNCHAMMDEFVVSMYAGNVRAAHEGLFDRSLVFGTISFGYRGEPIAGEFTKQKRPRCRLVVDPEASRWVIQIFHWFVDDRLTISAIVRRLNSDPSIPLPPRCLSGAWSCRAVRLLLSNGRYRGYWEYGRTQTIWKSKKDYAKQVLRGEPLRAAQIEELRIVPDALWHAAQLRLAESVATAAGRRPLDGNRLARPRQLNGLFYCSVHDRPLTVGGAYGIHMSCPECQVLPVDQRPLYSYLPRALALRQTARALAKLVRSDTELVATVIASCQTEAERLQHPDPRELDSLHRRRDGLDSRIAFVLRNPGQSDTDQRQAEAVLRELRREREEVLLALSRHEAACKEPVAVPTADDVCALLNELGTILASAATSDEQQEASEVREVIVALTGGRIDLEQHGERWLHRCWLRGRFRLRLLPYLVARASGVEASGLETEGPEVAIDYRAPTKPEELGDEAKKLEDQGLLQHEIAEALGIHLKMAAKVLDAWYKRHGQERPDGRARRKQLSRKQARLPRYKLLADEVKKLRDSGLAAQAVAARLGCDRNMELEAWNFWHKSRGLVPPRSRKFQESLNVGVGPDEAPRQAS
jgi:DNA invertase Pin-like site-specific DNA recombinase